jgi:hypothetical protein
VSKLFRNIIYDIPVGLSYEWRNIMFNATYRLGFARPSTTMPTTLAGWSPRKPLTARHHAICVTLGYKFKL